MYIPGNCFNFVELECFVLCFLGTLSISYKLLFCCWGILKALTGFQHSKL